MDTLTPVQMSDENLSSATGTVSLKKHLIERNNDGGGGACEEDDNFIDSNNYEVDENQQNNGLKRQRPSECVHLMSTTVKSHSKLPPTQQQQQQQQQQQKQQKCTYEQKARCKFANGENHQSNGFCHSENTSQAGSNHMRMAMTTATPLLNDNKDGGGEGDCGNDNYDDANFLTKFCENHNQNDAYFDAMISSDVCDVEIQLTDDKKGRKKGISDTMLLNGNGRAEGGADDDDDMESDRVIIKGHRRTRARSTDSIQTEFYETRKQQQLRLRSQTTADSERMYTNGSSNDFHQSHCDPLAFTTHHHDDITSIRGKSLSPPNLRPNRRQTISNSSFVYYNRSHQRYLIRPFSTIRRQKLLAKAKQAAAARQSPLSPLSPTTTQTPTAMGKTIAKTDLQTASSAGDATAVLKHPTDAEKPIDNNEDKGNSSDSEYSSLEDNDDDNNQDPTDSDENDLSDTEDSHLDNKAIYNSFKANRAELHPMLADSVQGRYPIDGCPLTPSLFPYVPPYITFAAHDAKGPPMPLTIKKVLKWKLTPITPIVIRKILLNSGFRLLKQTNDWMGSWGKHMKSPCFRTLRPYQKINHIPGTFQIGRKDKIWRNLQSQMLRNGRKEFNFMPLTYILPQDVKRLKRLWPIFDERNTRWIIKPPASARGTGIKVVSRWQQIPKRKPMIVQKYIDRPLLINGSKFDLRLYVLVTSLNPLRAYMHTDGLARFASVKYTNNVDTLSDRYMHLTNYSINKLSSNYTKNEDAESCSGHKWTLKTLWKYFNELGINTDGLWAALRNLVLRTVLSGEHVINQMAKANVGSRYNTFELFGIDVILDSALKPWLLEVNISPSLHSSSPLDLFVKGPMVTALLNTVRFNVPPRFNATQQAELSAELGLANQNLCYDRRLHVVTLSKAERIKHNNFTSKTISMREQYLDPILENLTPDDIRCLIASEDELARCAPLERICPTQQSHRFIKFTEKPRYYNRLLDAWEHRYSHRREEGIELLRKCCENRTHLIVPISCTKLNARKAATAPTTPAAGDELKNATELNSENEIDEVFDASTRAIPQKRAEYSDAVTPKIIDDCKSPIPMSDEQLNETTIDQHDILVSSIA